MAVSGYGFREVVLDQKFDGNWTIVNVPAGGGHSTFQGAKFSDFAGGYTYESNPNSHPALLNRMIYWRTLNDKLELIETSLDYNLHDNQARFVFLDSPIVGPVTIQEIDQHIVILVATVTSVNRIVFNHPRVLNYDKFMKNNAASIFFQIKNQPMFVLKSFNFAENCHNIPVPTSAASIAIQETGDCVFALSYESGGLSVIRVDKHDGLTNFDLRQSNVFVRMFSGFKQSVFSRNNQATTDASIGLSLFTTKFSSGLPGLFLATLTMNGRLRLWQCGNFMTFQDWPSIADVIVENVFITSNFTDCNMLLRCCISKETGLPVFVVYMPNRCFKFYHTKRNPDPRAPSPLNLEEGLFVDFRERDLIDFTLTNEYLFVLVSNPEEETDWQVKTYKISDQLNSRFNMALLEPLPNMNAEIYPSSLDPRSFYSDLIFNKSSFSISTIYKALGMFPSTCSFDRNEKDWDKTKEFAHNVVDYEIRMKVDSYEVAVSDDDYYHLCLETWLAFYNSCVEYHILTIKPLGIFFNENLGTLGIVKKSRLSFLRPTDYLETLYYFPHCVTSADGDEEIPEEQQPSVAMLKKLMDILELIESTTEEIHRKKIEKQLRRDRSKLMEVCATIAQLLTMTDPHSLLLERRHFAPSLEDKLRDPFSATTETLEEAISLVNSWNSVTHGPESMFDEGVDFSEYFMSSRYGANMLYLTLKQLIQHRFMISRNLVLLHSLLVSLFSSSDEDVLKIQFSLAHITDTTLAVNNSFLLLQMLDRPAEAVPDCIIDYGLKIANLLRANTSDHIMRGKLTDLSPMKLIEKFCESYLGNVAIRNFVSSSKGSSVLVFADAAGRAIWPSENSGAHPFEEFLISHCQYGALYDYAILMTTYLSAGRRTMQKFYRGLARLCDGDVWGALVQFKTINAADAMKDSYFLSQILCLPDNSEFQLLMFYQKIISLFQIFKEYRAVQDLAEAALYSCPSVKDRTMMASLAFKSALQVNDYTAAYDFVLRIPTYENDETRTEVREKTASIRTLLRQLLENCEIETLLALDLRHEFSPTENVQQKVEEILDAQAQLSDPLVSDGVYQMLYVYYIAKEKYYEGASAMYCRAERIGEKGGNVTALEAQRDSLLDVLTCLSCLPDRKQPLKIRKIGAHSIKPGGALVPGGYGQQEETIKSYDDIVKELDVCIALVTLSNIIPGAPVRPGEFPRRAVEVVHNLTLEHHYDMAIKIAIQWNLDKSPILVALATVYTKMVHDVRPASGDVQDYIRHNDISGLPVSNSSPTEVALRLLESYLKRLEKPCDSTLHRDVALEILSYDVSLPQWLVDSYKKRNTAQLMHCYLRYGEWKEATELANKVMDATLGRCPDREFDPTIRKIDAYEAVPVIPYTVIDMLQHQMELRYEIDGDPEKGALLKSLGERISDYCTRVIETRRERGEFFSALSY